MNDRIKKAMIIINDAIAQKTSVSEASMRYNYSKTYVKNAKSHVNKLRNTNPSLYNEFMLLYSKYVSSRKNDNQSIIDISNKDSRIDHSNLGDKITETSENGDKVIEWKGGSSYPKNHVKTLDELLDECNVDLELWKVRNYVVNKWDVTSWKNSVPQTVQNWQVKAWLERNQSVDRERKIGELFLDMIKTYSPPLYDWMPSGNKHIDSTENNLLEISIFDLHLGKLAWAGETYENYDTKIARDRFLYAVESLLHKVSGFKYSRILFPIGSDFFNSDTMNNTTTKGTPQDEDLRWQKTFDIGCKLLVDGINLLKQTGVPVDVICVPGNHDFERNYYLGKFLEAWFNNDPQVYIDTHASPRKYYKFGNVLIGLTHGNEEKEGNLPLLMATDIPSKPLWSSTKFHEWHIGHQHRKKHVKYNGGGTKDKQVVLNEDLGVTIRYLSSLTGTEEWHHKKGYVGQIKAADAFIWNDNSGFCAHLNTNIIID